MLGEPNVSAPIAAFLSLAVSLNILLAVFNMLPIPPLDGGNVLSGLLPLRFAAVLDQVRPYGFLILYALMFTERLLLSRGAAVEFPACPGFRDDDVRARVVSGMRPTGRLHLGHLVGALGNWVPLQDQYDCFYFVADWHALTSDYGDTSQLTSYAFDNVADWIGAGLDPEKSTFFIQSLVPEHAELYLLLSMVVPIPWLERVPTYKEQQDNLKDKDLSSIGFLGYPLLQTADVSMYDARFVPVGEDQVAHLELARESVRRFNNVFGGGPARCGKDVLVEPQPLLTKFGRLPGLDGDKKMSKSLGNTIHLSDEPDEVKKKVMRMYTDPKRVRADIPGTVEGNPVFVYHDAFNPDTAEVDDLKARYRAGKVGDVEVKTKLANALNAYLAPIRERRAAVLARPEQPARDPVRRVEARPGRGGRDDGACAGRGEDLHYDEASTTKDTADLWNVLCPRVLVVIGDRWIHSTISNRAPTPLPSGSSSSRGRSICCCTSSGRTR